MKDSIRFTAPFSTHPKLMHEQPRTMNEPKSMPNTMHEQPKTIRPLQIN